jgi:hypothetical protein
MMKSPSPKKSRAGAPGTKALLTAASLAITLGGWAAFTRANGEAADVASAPPAIVITLPRPRTDLKLAPQLLPTIIPAPPPPPQLALSHPPVLSAALLSDSAPVAAQAAAPVAAQPAAAAPEPPAAIQLPAAAPLPVVDAPPLRAVSPPPAPVARTRSSK